VLVSGQKLLNPRGLYKYDLIAFFSNKRIRDTLEYSANNNNNIVSSEENEREEENVVSLINNKLFTNDAAYSVFCCQNSRLACFWFFCDVAW
jgi:hypothetical protein